MLLSLIGKTYVLPLIGAYTFIVSGIIINLLQACCLILWPISKSLYRRCVCFFAYQHWVQMVFFFDHWAKAEIIFYHEKNFIEMLSTEHALIVMNHRFDVDFLVTWSACEKFGILGSSKSFVKEELKYIPIVGWGFSLIEMVFLKRNFLKDRKALVDGISILKDYPVKSWMLLFCEGTRFTREKQVKANEVAKEKGLKELKYHLLPRTKGFSVITQAMKGVVPAMYDVTLCCKDEPTFMQVVSAKKMKFHVLTRRIAADNIPTDTDEESAAFCHKLYQEKDDAVDYFHKHDTLEGYQGKYVGTKLSVNNGPVLVFIFWSTLLFTPFAFYMIYLLYTGTIYTYLALTVGTYLAYLLCKRMISETVTSKGSTYGSTISNGDATQSQMQPSS
ncbi:1-acyl-sn-glycerol-3-phosphate acyltransferase gamma-like [Anneissia japonica]|uniref:1-acyl-sn-glycerol-3-phosphate acyltransferase gamma-like n=1 Tax=Anneissia japonica TaxID=1529436 RepID=UPI001425774C|nr:1-acyl-sn-glycerol-3-phosphate acyltransferase gamma-like [Anneissia japonica]XP_033113263.1 1-acyl-sn-glycerol-3-phosphate acyltransferase gamma-like [Anneissia japonica]XP_033113264.1 1-acyl-sn-glycerol-3-phosphate acyltransferase gamma-like [Anneissia japonica]